MRRFLVPNVLLLCLLAGMAVSSPAPLAHAKGKGTVTVDGFRSAKFGMDIAETRASIKKDFEVPDEKIEQGRNKVEKTTYLKVPTGAIVPGSGTCIAAYIFGYKSKQLFQVNVTCGSHVDGSQSPQDVTATATIIVRALMAKKFPPDSVITNKRYSPNDVLVFLGRDQDGRSVSLSLKQLPAQAKEAKEAKADAPEPQAGMALFLSYAESERKQDVYHPEDDAF